MRILIIEDDRNLALALGRILKDNEYDVDVAYEGISGQRWAENSKYDAIICDIMLPGKDGFEISKDLRRAKIDTPILLLTARDATADKILGLDSGADDYMTKPFSPQELMAHLRALTRRKGQVVFETIDSGDLVLDLNSFEIACGERSIKLSAKEFDLARVLMENPGRLLSKQRLIESAWGIDSCASENNIEAYISFLRKKMRHIGSNSSIETIRNAGYRLI